MGDSVSSWEDVGAMGRNRDDYLKKAVNHD